MLRHLPDAKVLLHALRVESPARAPCRAWLETLARTGAELLLTEVNELTLLRIGTHPRHGVAPRPIFLDYWQSLLAYPRARRIAPGDTHAATLRRFAESLDLQGNDLNDAWLAALAIEHSAILISTDESFKRFPGLIWQNPTRP